MGRSGLDLRRVILVLNQKRRAHQDDHDRGQRERDDGFDEREASNPSRYQTADLYEVAEYVGAPVPVGVSVTTIRYSTGVTSLISVVRP